jgi:hypothetical protein
MAEQPIDETHETRDGPVRILVSPDGAGWQARIRGPAIEAARNFHSVEEANAWARGAFRAMFPE